MARRMIRKRGRRATAVDATLRYVRHAARRGLPAAVVIWAARLCAEPAPYAAVGRRAELERLYGRRIVSWTRVSSRHPDLWLVTHWDPLARVHLRRAIRARAIAVSRGGASCG